MVDVRGDVKPTYSYLASIFWMTVIKESTKWENMIVCEYWC